MSLSYEILRFVDRVRRQPADGSDPRLLARLEKYAKEQFEGIVALHAPASPMTWEANTFMPGDTQTTNRQGFTFPRPVEIVGFYPTILRVPPEGEPEDELVLPTLDAIAVSIDSDTESYLTVGDGVSTPAGGKAGPFVTLAAMSVHVPRVVGYKLRNAAPNLGITYRWKLDVSAGAVFDDCLVSLAIFARYL